MAVVRESLSVTFIDNEHTAMMVKDSMELWSQ